MTTGGGVRRSSVASLRASITLDALRHELEQELLREGLAVNAHTEWPPVLAQIRISKADTDGRGMSQSPGRQLTRIAEFCVRYQFNPIELCFEAQSGHLTDRRPRKLFEAFRERVESGELTIAAVVTYNIDRFTRHRYIGERWLETLKARGVDLHEADKMEAPLPLAQREEEFALAFVSAWRESHRMSKRVRDAKSGMARKNLLLGNVNYFGHRPVWGEVDGRRQQVEAILDVNESILLQEAAARIADGVPLSRIVTEMNDQGVRGRRGAALSHSGMLKVFTSPRMIGMQRLGGEMVDAPIPPILDHEV